MSVPREIEIVRAGLEDAPTASAILTGAATWLTGRDETLWFPDELTPERFMAAIEAGELYLVKKDGAAVGTVILQDADNLYWPDMRSRDALYIHKLAFVDHVRGRGLGRKVIAWAKARACSAGMTYLRLDTEAARTRLCAFYESAGFHRHSERQVGRHYVARYEMRVR
ncbi:MAG: GNAT family N-acetyltransferase [Deltaproteobacteria bacterium]|nr:GNAT family N-acetyltransferase [Deltaproteobacteria bacterium]